MRLHSYLTQDILGSPSLFAHLAPTIFSCDHSMEFLTLQLQDWGSFSFIQLSISLAGGSAFILQVTHHLCCFQTFNLLFITHTTSVCCPEAGLFLSCYVLPSLLRLPIFLDWNYGDLSCCQQYSAPKIVYCVGFVHMAHTGIGSLLQSATFGWQPAKHCPVFSITWRMGRGKDLDKLVILHISALKMQIVGWFLCPLFT